MNSICPVQVYSNRYYGKTEATTSNSPVVSFQGKDQLVKSFPQVNKKSVGLMGAILGFLGIGATANSNNEKIKPSQINKIFDEVYLSMAIIHNEDEKNSIQAKYDELINIFDKQCKNEERKKLATKILEYYKSDECLDYVTHAGGPYNIMFKPTYMTNLRPIMETCIDSIHSRRAPKFKDVKDVEELLELSLREVGISQ